VQRGAEIVLLTTNAGSRRGWLNDRRRIRFHITDVPPKCFGELMLAFAAGHCLWRWKQRELT